MKNVNSPADLLQQSNTNVQRDYPHGTARKDPIINSGRRKYSKVLRDLFSVIKGEKKAVFVDAETAEAMGVPTPAPKQTLKIVLPNAETGDPVSDAIPLIEPVTERPEVPALHHVDAMKVRKRIIQTPEQLAAHKDKEYPFIFDSHFHVENYRQQGVSVAAFLNMMDNVGLAKAVLFGLPLRQTVLYDELEGGHYYTDSDLPLYYYSGTDYYLAEQYRHLSAADKERLYPMITGINPVDVGAVDDIIRLLQIFPNTFVGVGEITVHKEIVTAKIAGEKPALYSKGLNKIFDFAGRTGLVCLLHNDIDTMMAKDETEMPRYFEMLLSFFQTHKHTQIIWAHCGLGRYVTFDDKYIPLLDHLLETCPNVHVDIAWDEVAKYIVKNSQTIKDWNAIICKYPDRFLYGSDLIAPRDSRYVKTFNHYKPLLDTLPKAVAQAVVYGNAERIFERARKAVNQWTEFNVPKPGIVYETLEGNDTNVSISVRAE